MSKGDLKGSGVVVNTNACYAPVWVRSHLAVCYNSLCKRSDSASSPCEIHPDTPNRHLELWHELYFPYTTVSHIQHMMHILFNLCLF